jgi:alkylated DNA repair dioxygenase AlkB
MHQRSLLGIGDPVVDRSVAVERIELDEQSWVDVGRGWLRGADSLLDALIDHVEWRRGRRWMYDRMVDDPRLSRWYRRGDAMPHPAFELIRLQLEARYRVPLSGPGLNYYRDGRDSVAFHRDRELRHLDDTLIAIVTLGAERPFLVRPRGKGASHNVSPASGDLLVMGGRCQRDWEHGVPKLASCGPRISATWRWSSKAGPPEQGPRRARSRPGSPAGPARPR